MEQNKIKEDVKKAIQYVRENKSWSKEEEDHVLDEMNEKRCSLQYASDNIYCEIADLMNDWGDDNDYDVGWWLYYTSEEEVFMEL